MAGEWRAALAELQTRVDAFENDGRAEHVTADEAVVLAESTWRGAHCELGAVPLEAALAVARLYMARHRAVSPRAPADDVDLGFAVGIYVMIDEVAPEAVPPQVRGLVDEARRAADEEPFDDAAERAVVLLRRVQLGEEPDSLDEAILRFRHLLDALLAHEAATSDADSTASTRAALMSDLSLALHLRIERTGDSSDVAEALQLAREALRTVPPDYDDAAGVAGNAATVLATTIEYTGRLADLDEAIAIATGALDRLAVGSPQWAHVASNLSGMLRIRFDRRDNLADISEAVRLATTAAETLANDATWAALCWSNVASAFEARYGWTRTRTDLDRAIEAGRRALRVGTPSDPSWATLVSNVANLYLTRFEQWRGVEDLTESIVLAKHALRATLSPPKRMAVLSNLGNALRQRYEHLHRQADLDDALWASAAALELASPDDPLRASLLNNRAMALLCDFDRSGDPEALAGALAAARAAVGVPGVRPSLLSMLYSSLALVLASSADRAEDRAARSVLRRDAVAAGQRAVEVLPAGHPSLAIRLYNLASATLDFAEDHADRDGVHTSIGLYGQAAEVVAAPVSVRVRAARSRGAVAAGIGDWPLALAAYGRATGLLSSLVTRAITRASREILLNQFALVASEAAACALTAAEPDLATELLELGRALLWSQALETGAALALRTADEPLARRLAEIALELH